MKKILRKIVTIFEKKPRTTLYAMALAIIPLILLIFGYIAEQRLSVVLMYFILSLLSLAFIAWIAYSIKNK